MASARKAMNWKLTLQIEPGVRGGMHSSGGEVVVVVVSEEDAAD